MCAVHVRQGNTYKFLQGNGGVKNGFRSRFKTKDLQFLFTVITGTTY